MSDAYSLMVHGGAGTMDHLNTAAARAACLKSIRDVLERGREILARGGSALQAVEACASLLEDDPQFNAGCGSVLNAHGKVEMDAAIMDGRDLSAGAVAAVSNIANPVRLAGLVMARSGHVMLAGAGALEFAAQCGMQQVPDDCLVTRERLREYLDARCQGDTVPLREDSIAGRKEEQNPGTIGAIARDIYGNLAAATSTGGVANKHRGRIGDSPIIGAGVYADNETCAISATGNGEDFMRSVLAKTIAGYMELSGHDAARATRAGIEYLMRKVNGQGGVIVIDSAGNCASRFTTRCMIHGWIERGGTAMRAIVNGKY